jgi:3-hydroxyacyl-CoA dehydrogenase
MAGGRGRVVAVVGTGTIGRSWIRVFTRGGYETRAWDPDSEKLHDAATWLKADLKLARKRQDLRKAVAKSQRELLTLCESLEEVVDGVSYVQECGPEDLAVKRGIFCALDQAAGEGTILASSSATIGLEALTNGLSCRPHCIIAHPLNAPHVVPVVEVFADSDTDTAVIRRTFRFLRRVGLIPVAVRHHQPGLIASRLEAALIREAIDLVRTGTADLAAIETVMTDGLGLCWSLQGPVGTVSLKADGGVREHLARYASIYEGIWDDLTTDLRLTPELIDQVAQALDPLPTGVTPEDHRAWRDDLVDRVRRTKAAHPLEGDGFDENEVR